MALDATIGGSTANSYVTVNEADTFFSSHYSLTKASTWAALSTAQKESALKRATQILDTLRVLDNEFSTGSLPLALVIDNAYELTIHRQLVGQRLQFPRNIDIDTGDVPFIPQNVKDAECEQAVHLLNFDEATLATQMLGITTESVGAGTVRIRQEFGRIGTAHAPLALELMREYLRPTRRVQRA
jgi:hypothetical protein